MAVDFPGLVAFNLYSEGKLIFSSSPASAPIGEVIFFGVLSDQPFDAAFIRDPSGGEGLTIDNLFFGDVIPAPGAMALFAVAAIAGRRRRPSSR